MAAANRSLATALWEARFASGLLRRCYTTSRDTTDFKSTSTEYSDREKSRFPTSPIDSSRARKSILPTAYAQ
jgi:hypothetical protein